MLCFDGHVLPEEDGRDWNGGAQVDEQGAFRIPI
jgi:hypothetical protein